MIFGAFSTGNANAFGPDVSKAKTAAEKIFAVTETVSEIDVMSEEKDKTQIDKGVFRGEIEFREVTMKYREGLEPSIKNLSFKV